MNARVTPPRYVRPMSGMERFSLAINEVYRYNVVSVVEGSGPIDRDVLQAAVDAAAAANPGLRVRLRAFLRLSRWVDSGIAPTVRCFDDPDWNWRTEHNAGFIHERFDALGGGPIADVGLVTGARTCVVFRALHAAMDGGGMLHWMTEVFRALRGEPLLGSPSTLTDFEVARRHLTPTPKPDRSQPSPQPVLCHPTLPLSPQQAAPLHYVWRVVQVPRAIHNILPRLAIFLSQHARLHTDGPIGFTVPVDLRSLRADVRSTGNLTGYLRIYVEATDTPRLVMQKLSRQIRERAECRAPLEALRTRWMPVRTMARRVRDNVDQLLYETNQWLPSGGLVSMGNVELPTFDAPGFQAEMVVGIPGSVGKLNVLFGVLSGETVLVLSTPSRYSEDGQIDALARALEEAFA